MRDEVWEQAIRLARALDYANTAGNTEAAEIHRAALIDTLKHLMEMYNG